MANRFFVVPIQDNQEAADEFNRFLANRNTNIGFRLAVPVE